MASGGTNKKPLKVLKMEGSYREDRHGQPSKAMETATGLPKKPRSLNGVASELWDTICKQQKNYLSESDGTALLTLCKMYALMIKVEAKLDGDETDKDTRIAYTSYFDRVEKLLAKFGMTPSDRARLGEVSKEDHDPAAEFIA